jgi:cyclophilin family peptidyl-prolyl cis-trans isomerase
MDPAAAAKTAEPTPEGLTVPTSAEGAAVEETQWTRSSCEEKLTALLKEKALVEKRGDHADNAEADVAAALENEIQRITTIMEGLDHDNKKVYLEVSMGGAALPTQIVIELYWDTYPKTCDAFLRLCQGTVLDGTAGTSPSPPTTTTTTTAAASAAAATTAAAESGAGAAAGAAKETMLTYKGTKLGKVIANFLVQGGQVPAAVPGIVDSMDEQLTELAAFRAKRFGSSNNFNKPFQVRRIERAAAVCRAPHA